MPRSPPLSATLTLSLVLLAAALPAGCLGPDGSGGVGAIPASQAREAARAQARDWQPDARLLLLSGVEAGEGSVATREVPDGQGGSSRPAPVDESVGDGRAPSWTALFYSEEANTTRTYRVVGAQVEALGNGTAPSTRPRVVPDGTVDSPDVVGTALGNQSFRRAALAGDGEVVMTLGIGQEGPVWQLLARSRSKAISVQLVLSATNGTVLGTGR